MDNDYTLIYAKVNETGDIQHGYIAGTRAFPTEQYDYFFRKPVGEINTDRLVELYKVEVNGFKPELVLKEETPDSAK